MLVYLFAGIVNGFAAAAQPGPFQAFLVAQAVAHGWRRTLAAAFAPLLSDGPVIVLVLLVLSRLPPQFLNALRIAGGLFILYLAAGAYRTWRAWRPESVAPPPSRSVIRAALVNLLNPNPYLGWSLVLGPLLLKGWRETPANGVALLAGFYGVLIPSSAAIVVLAASARSLGPRATRALIGISALGLAALGAWLLVSGLRSVYDSTMLSRRRFLETAASVALSPGLRAQPAETRVEVLLEEPIARIAPEIYSHFVENLGGVVYDGIWVGENSSIPNSGGIRKQLADALARVKPGAIRWPGGCFADQYDWRDGIGPRDQRPRRTNFWVDAPEWPAAARRNGPQTYDPNRFGTAEFVRFCRLANGQPYVAANLRSLPPQQFWRWVEYCNSPARSTTLAEQRARDGFPEPLNVRFWGVGNESWGCGGDFTPEDYATEFRRYTAWLPSYGVPLALVGSGPNGGDVHWTRGFFSKAGPALGHMWGWALHHYSWNASGGRSTEWLKAKGDALRFDAEQYYEILREGNLMESLIQRHWDAMGEVDRDHKVKLVVDEWGAWYAPGTEPFAEALLGQQSTMRDAVLAGMTLDTFNRHADKIGMANVAQLVNNLQALFFAHEDKFCVTPTYHVFDLYAAHQNAQSLRTVYEAPAVRYTRNGSPATLPGLSASASLTGGRLTLTLTNPSLDQPREANIALRGGTAKSASAVVLAAADPHAHNSFDNPNAVAPKSQALSGRGASFVQTLPPASVTKLEIALA